MKKTGPDFKGRLSRAREALKEKGLGCLLLTDIFNIRYLSGFTGSSALMILTPDDGFFLTDTRYHEQALDEVHGSFRVKVYKRKGIEEAARLVSRIKPGVAGFEGASLSYDRYREAAKALKGVRVRSAGRVINRVREVKDRHETALMREAARLLDMGFKEASRVLVPGVIEKDASFSLEIFLRKRGADALAFNTIVASGTRASLPHAKASGKRIRGGELIVLDMGVRKDGYNSDETRTFTAGRPSRFLKKVYNTVFEAQRLAINRVGPGVRAFEIDKAARGHIRKAGFGKFFGHALGHGVGLEVHEGPVIGPESADVLEEGMVFTVEPGVYVPGVGGVRIEDMVLVTRSGCEVLTKSAKQVFSMI